MNARQAHAIVSLYRNLSFINKLHIYVRLRRLPFEIIEKYVPRRGKILDFGCGHGFFSLYMSKKSKDRSILGIDISKKKIDIASRSIHDRNVSFEYSDKTVSYLKERFCYNAIVILNVLYLLKRNDQKNIIKNASGALNKNGKLLIVEPDANLRIRTFYEVVRESIMIRLLGLTKGATLTYNTKKWWMGNLKKYFRQIECIEFSKKKHHLLYVCSK